MFLAVVNQVELRDDSSQLLKRILLLHSLNSCARRRQRRSLTQALVIVPKQRMVIYASWLNNMIGSSCLDEASMLDSQHLKHLKRHHIDRYQTKPRIHHCTLLLFLQLRVLRTSICRRPLSTDPSKILVKPWPTVGFAMALIRSHKD